MRTHIQIIKDAGGYQAMAAALGLDNERVRFWERRESIPLESWRAIAGADLATMDELLEAAEARATHRAPSSKQDAA